jgi:hypothetical protein
MMVDKLSRTSYRSRSAYSMAELPVALWFILIGMLFPLLIMTSMGYRASILYFAGDSACKKAAKAPSFTEAGVRANAALKANLASFSGLSKVTPTLFIIVKPLSGGSAAKFSGKLAEGTVDTSKNIYFLLMQVDADIDPIVRFDKQWMGMAIPGLTDSYSLRINHESYVENPNGLTE